MQPTIRPTATLLLSCSAILLAGCESFGDGGGSRYGGPYGGAPYRYPTYSQPYLPPQPAPPAPAVTALQQKVAILERENESQRQTILQLMQNVDHLNRTVCLLSTRLERARVRTDPANGRNYVMADAGPVRTPSERC